MSLKLYEFSSSRSVRVHWMLRELGLNYNQVEVNLRQGQHRSPEYLKINPNGKVPTLVDGEQKIWESGAILIHLAEKYPEKKLIPAVGDLKRSECFQWMFWNQSEFEAPLWIMAKHTFVYPKEKRIPDAIDLALGDLHKAASILENELSDRVYILGGSFSAADILLGHTALWAQEKNLLTDYPHIKRYLSALAQRPAFPIDKIRPK